MPQILFLLPYAQLNKMQSVIYCTALTEVMYRYSKDDDGMIDNLSERQLNVVAEVVFANQERIGCSDEIPEEDKRD
jgi:hypothetical protein